MAHHHLVRTLGSTAQQAFDHDGVVAMSGHGRGLVQRRSPRTRGGAQDVEDLLEALLPDDVADTHQVDVLRRHLDRQVTLSHLELEIHLLFALDSAHLDFFNFCCTVVRVNYCLADLKNHVDFPLSRRPVYHD